MVWVEVCCYEPQKCVLPFLLIYRGCHFWWLQQIEMSNSKEVVISLIGLTLPEEVHPSKVTLSVKLLQEEKFIQKQRVVKNQHINLFRENIFLTQPTSTLAFQIYSVGNGQQSQLLKELKVTAGDFDSIKKLPTMFKSNSDNFELTWDAWIFSENSTDFEGLSERDYSELNLPFFNEDEDEEYFFEGMSRGETGSPTSQEIDRGHEYSFTESISCKDWKPSSILLQKMPRLERKNSGVVKSKVYAETMTKINEFFRITKDKINDVGSNL